MNLREVRKKTKSIKNVRKITKAMQMISAIKMRKAQQIEVEGRPYREILTSVIDKIIPAMDMNTVQLLQTKNTNTDKKMIIIISSNKGLCGAFHVNLYRLLLANISNFGKADFVTLGSKGSQFVSRMGGNVIADYSQSKFLNEISAIFNFALDNYLNGGYDSISLVYNKYISAFKSEPVEEILFPFVWNNKPEIEKKTLKLEYAIEPSVNEIIEPLLKSYLEEKIRGAVISSEAVEHASRMMAMKNATDNASDIIYNLTLVGNKLRQENITSELLDMITAKESVETG